MENVEMRVNLAVAHGILCEMSEKQRYKLLMHLSGMMLEDEPEKYFYAVDFVKEKN